MQSETIERKRQFCFGFFNEEKPEARPTEIHKYLN